MNFQTIIKSQLLALFILSHVSLVSCKPGQCILELPAFIKSIKFTHILCDLISSQKLIGIEYIQYIGQLFLVGDLCFLAVVITLATKYTIKKLLNYWSIISTVYIIIQFIMVFFG